MCPMRDFSFDLVLEFSVWSVIVLYCANKKILWDALFNMLHSFHSFYLLSLLASSVILVSPWPDSNTISKLFHFDEYSANLYGSSWFSISFSRARCVVLCLMRVLVLKHTAIPFMHAMHSMFSIMNENSDRLHIWRGGVGIHNHIFCSSPLQMFPIYFVSIFSLENDEKLFFFLLLS